MTQKTFKIVRYISIATMAAVYFLTGGLPDEAPIVTAVLLAYGSVGITLEVLFAAARAIRENEIQQDTYEDIFVRTDGDGELAAGTAKMGDEI